MILWFIFLFWFKKILFSFHQSFRTSGKPPWDISSLYRPLRKHLFYVNIALFAAFIVAISLFAARYDREFYKTEAVIIAGETDCKFEPFIGATTFFTLSEGQSVAVLMSSKDWLKIKRPDGKQGWVKARNWSFCEVRKKPIFLPCLDQRLTSSPSSLLPGPRDNNVWSA